METYEAIRSRISVRSYSMKPVPDEVLDRVLETGRIAPSASNYQPWHFIVVTDPKKRAALSGGRWAKFLKECPVVIVGCGDKKKSPGWNVVDVSIALQQMVIAATAEGLGTCWIGSFYEDRVKKALNIPEKWGVVAMLTVGYPKKDSDLDPSNANRSRKDFGEIVSQEEFGTPRTR